MNRQSKSIHQSVEKLGRATCKSQENWIKLPNCQNVKFKLFRHQGAKFALNIW